MEKRHLLVTIRTTTGELQRRIISLERYCTMQEVNTEGGKRTLIKFIPDSMQGARHGDAESERPIYALESIDEIMVALGTELAYTSVQRKRRSRAK